MRSKGILALQKGVAKIKNKDGLSPKTNPLVRSPSGGGGLTRGRSGKSLAIFGGMNRLLSIVEAKDKHKSIAIKSPRRAEGRDTPKSVRVKSKKRSRVASKMTSCAPSQIARFSSITPSMNEISMTVTAEDSPKLKPIVPRINIGILMGAKGVSGKVGSPQRSGKSIQAKPQEKKSNRMKPSAKKVGNWLTPLSLTAMDGPGLDQGAEMISTRLNYETETSDRDGQNPFGYRDLKSDILDTQTSYKIIPINITHSPNDDGTRAILTGQTLKNIRFITGEDPKDDPE